MRVLCSVGDSTLMLDLSEQAKVDHLKEEIRQR